MTWTEIANFLAILISPIAAVLVTLHWQKRKTKQDMKDRLFITLMAERKSYPPSYDLVKALNLIDVVFYDSPEVIKAWHEYYNSLVSANTEVEFQERQRKYLDLIHAIAQSMGYEKLKQTDIDKFYTPIAHGNQAVLNEKLQTELVRVLENTERFLVAKKPDASLIEPKQPEKLK